MTRPLSPNVWVPSKAVIAAGKHNQCFMWITANSLLEQQISDVSERPDDLGFDDAPLGVSIWEGDFKWIPGGYECPQDGELDPAGAYRDPTVEEWKAIQERRNPFEPASTNT